MKNSFRFITLCLLAALLLLPLGNAQAKGSDDGPFWGESVVVKSGEIFQGDLAVFGGSVTIEQDSAVNGSVIVIGGNLTADGNVQGDMIVVGGAVTLEQDSAVNGSVIVIGGNLTADGNVQGDLIVVGGAVTLASNAHVSGSLFTMGAPISRAEGARVDGSVLNNPQKPSAVMPEVVITPGVFALSVIFDGVLGFFDNFVNLFFQSIGFGLLAALLVWFLPQQTRRIGEAISSQPAWAAAMGLGSILLFITALVVLALFSLLIVTLLLTIPVIIVILITFAAAVVFGWVGLGTEIGLRLAAALKTEFPFPLSAGVGTFLLHLVANGFGMIPCLGWVVPTLLSLVSLGAVFLTRFGAHPLSITATQVSVESVPPAETF